MATRERISDEELARRAREGCARSFETLVGRFQVPLIHFLRQRTNAAEAEDLAQDTFLRAYENLDRYDPGRRFSTWLFTIGYRLCANARRKTRPAGDDRHLGEVESDQPTPDDAVSGREGRGRLWETAVTMLSEPEFTAVWLHYVEDLPTAEIGSILGRSRGAVKTMLLRSRRKLSHVLREIDEIDQAKADDPPPQPPGRERVEANHD
jgi:RNA polymerase sigma-70 factor (ECF subfamily)